MRKGFNFLNSYYRVYKKLQTDLQKIEFIEAILKVQSLEVRIDDLTFNDPIVDLAFEGVKHSLQTSVDGYLSKVGELGFRGAYEHPCQGGNEGPCQQEEEEEEEKEEVQEEEEVQQGIDSESVPSEGSSEAIDYNFYSDTWNKFCSDKTIAPIKSLNAKRKSKIKTREKEGFRDVFVEMLGEIEKSDFLLGNNDQKWKVSFDWIIHNDTNYMKVLEGNYRGRSGKKQNSSSFVDSYFEKKNSGDTIKDGDFIEGVVIHE